MAGVEKSKVVLYGLYKSSATWRVRIALAFKGIEYEKKMVSLEKKDNQSAEYKAINPMGQIPSLSIDGNIINQSLPIIEYLEERNSSPALLPKDRLGRAKVRAITEVVNSGIQPLQNATVIAKLQESHPDWGHFYCSKGLQALEDMLKETSGKYSYGDQVTLADLFIVPQIYNSYTRFSVDISKYPTVSRIYEDLVKLPEFKVADPRRQPDTPENEKINDNL